MRKFLYALLFIAAFAACKKDETLRYSNVTMGNIDGESIISDQGNTFNIAESLLEIKLEDCNKRVLVVCDVLKETAEKTYDIRLTGIANVLEKNVKTMADSTPEEDLTVNDPVVIRKVWYSGGYLNMTIETVHKRGSETPHYINLVQEVSEDGKYTFVLRHNAQGETPGKEDMNYVGATGYVSFPISGVISGDTAKLILKWKSHKFAGDGYSMTESEDREHDFNWTRGGHEHAPRTLSLKSSSGIL